MGSRRKQPSRQRITKPGHAAASKAPSASKDSTLVESIHLEHKNVTAPNENKKAHQANSTPQEQPGKPAESEMTPLPKAAETAAVPPPNEDEQPTPPRLPKASQRSNPPEARPPEPTSSLVPLRPTAEDKRAAEPPTLPANLDWMPPPEDRVAQFLNDVADIAPLPTREREGNTSPSFILPSATSPEEAERKKARAEPFWSQVVATPMEPAQSTPASSRSRRTRRPRSRHLIRWLALLAAILILLGIALVVIITQYPGLLHR